MSIFIFVQELKFDVNGLAGIFLAISLIITSVNFHAGGRVLGVALLGTNVWGFIIAGVMVSPDAYLES